MVFKEAYLVFNSSNPTNFLMLMLSSVFLLQHTLKKQLLNKAGHLESLNRMF